MVRGGILVVVALLFVVDLGCKPGCDEAPLRRAAAAFAGRSLEQRGVGMQALDEACPTLPSALRWNLLADFTEMPADERMAVHMDRAGDAMWNELLLRTCPRALEPFERGGTPAEHDHTMRGQCELDRYGLLAPDELFGQRDLGPFMLYEWLVSQRVERALAREVVRPLLVVEAPPEEREAMCLRHELACDTVLEAWGLRPPRSNGDLELEGAPVVHVTASAIAYEGTIVVPLSAGRPAPGVFVGHVSSALLRRLETHPDVPPGPAAPSTSSWPKVRLVVAADHATPVATLVDIAFTASRMGFSRIDLVVHGEHGLVGLPLAVPYTWFPPPEGRRFERALEQVFVVRRDAVEAHMPDGSPTRLPALAWCEPPPAGCHDHEALAAYVARVKQAFPHETVATFRAEGDVPLQALVSLVDTVRGGERCKLTEAIANGEAIPDECLFWQAILDLEPPLPRGDDLGSRGEGEGG